MARVHGMIGMFLALVAVIFYIVGLATAGTYESDTAFNNYGQVQLGPFNLCVVSTFPFNSKDCAAPDTSCSIATTGTALTPPYTLPKCDTFNAYRATLVIALAFGILGLGVMAYTTCRTGSWTAYLIASGLVGVSALFGLIQMAIAANYKDTLQNTYGVTYDLKYGFALPLVAWIIQIPACIVFAATTK